MPEQKKKKTDVAPSQSWWERIFGSEEMTPEILAGIELARKELPDLGAVESYGPISNLLMNNANAYVSPGRQMYINPSSMAGFSPEDVADTITHEQQHVRQMNERNTNPVQELWNNSIFGRGFGANEPYHRRPDEMEAFKAEEERRAKQGRMGARPSFLTGTSYVPQDIRLRQPDIGPSIAERQTALLGRRR